MGQGVRRCRATRRARLLAALLAATALSSVQSGRAQVVYTDGDVVGTTLTLTAPTSLFIDTGLATQSGLIDESGGAFGIVKSGGGTLVLANPANSYSGGTTINLGAISVAADGYLGDAGGALAFGGGTLIATGSFTSGRAITLDAGGGTIDTGGNALFLSGDIGGSGGLTKRGGGELVLTGASATYTGVTRIEQGLLTAGSFFSTSAASVHDIGAGATLRVLDNVIAEIGLISGSGTLELQGQSALWSGNIAGTAVFSGIIDGASGTASLQHLGAGTQILTGLGSALGGSLAVCGCGGAPLILRGGSLFVAGDIQLVQSGRLTVDRGGALTQSPGRSFVLQGHFSVDGAGTQATIGGVLTQPGVAVSLAVTNGAVLTSGGVSLEGASSSGSPGSATAGVAGAGSRWTIGGGGLSIGLGGDGTASVSVSSGGALVVSQIAIASNGTLRIGQGGLGGTVTGVGDSPPTILNNGAIVADFTDVVTLAANIEADSPDHAGTLTKRGAGTLILTGTNSYTGNTTLEGGVLSVASDASLGAASSGLTFNGGTLQVTGTSFSQTGRWISFGAGGAGFDIVEANHVFTVPGFPTSGPGGISKAGAGTLVLTTANFYSGPTLITGGTLRAGAPSALSSMSAFTVNAGATLDLGGFSQGIGGLSGAGTVLIGKGSLTIRGASTTFAGALSGTGSLFVINDGLTLTGVSDFTGATNVVGNFARLVVNGSLAGSVVNVNGGTLGGSGTVGGINAVSGTVAPGNSIGTLSVAGNVTFRPGSTYRVEANAAGQADRITATGTALLTGGLVQVLAEQGDYALSTRYVILTAQGGVGGTFSSLTSNLAFLTPRLTYEPNNVVLTLARNDVAFAAPPGIVAPAATQFVAITRNQTGVGRVAETLGAGNRVHDALISSTIAEARAGFDALSGEAHAQGVSVTIETSRLVREAVLSRLRAPFETSASRGSVQGAFSADLPGRKGGVALSAPRIETSRVTLLGEAVGAAGRRRSDGNADALERRGGGMLAGVELESNGVSPWRIGALAGFTRHHLDLDARRSRGTQDAVHAALYGGAKLGAFALRAGAAYAWNETGLTRQVLLRGLSDVLRHDGQGSTLQGFAEIGYELRAGAVAFEPFAQIAWVHVRSEAGTEQGGAAALRVSGSSRNLGFATLGLRAEAQIAGLPLFARGMLGWRHAFGETTPSAQLAFASGGAFRVYAAPLARDALVAEAGLSWRVSGTTSLGVAYSAALGDGQRDHALTGRLDVRF